MDSAPSAQCSSSSSLAATTISLSWSKVKLAVVWPGCVCGDTVTASSSPQNRYRQNTNWARLGGRPEAALMATRTPTLASPPASEWRLPEVLSIDTRSLPETSPCWDIIGVW